MRPARQIRHGYARWLQREIRAGDRLPYAALFDDETIALKGGALMQTIYLQGFPFETADTEELNFRHNVRNIALRAIGDSRFSVYHHIIRHRIRAGLEAHFADPVAAWIDRQWQERLSSRSLFVNDLYLTIVRHDARGKVGLAEKCARLMNRSGGEAAQKAAEIRAHKELQAAVQALMAALKDYGPHLLSRYDSENGPSSEPLELLSALYNGEMRPVLAPPTPPAEDIGHYIPYRRVSFGLDALELSPASGGRDFAAILSLKDYPAFAMPGIIDAIERLPFEMVISQTFSFVERQIGLERIALATRRLRAADDDVASLRAGLSAAKDDLATGQFALGAHHMTVLIRCKSLDALNAAAAETQAALADIGAVAVREDLNLEPAFWAQFPGQENYIARKALISSQAFAAFSSLHGFPIGRAEGNHWGQAVTVFETTSATPYYFNFHNADLGNFTVIGPSGTGKTVVMNFLAAQAQKFSPRTVLFDKDRGAEIFIRAISGTYSAIRTGEASGFNPLQLADTPANRAFLRSLISQLVRRPDTPLSPEEDAVIADAIDSNYQQAPLFRRLRYLRELMAGTARPAPDDLAARLAPWCGDGEAAWLFDNETDGLSLAARVIGFDMTELLGTPRLRTPAMMYLFHRIEQRLDGSPALIMIDEGWKALDDDVFAAAIRNWMKTLRKRNAILGFATQSARDALDSRIASAITEQAATQIFMPNPRAQTEDYCRGFGLTEHELSLIRSLPEYSRCFLIKHGNESVIARLDLSAYPELIQILSGRESTVRKLDGLRARLGDAPVLWWQDLTGQPYPGSITERQTA